MQVCEVCEFCLVTSVHQINARSPTSTLTDTDTKKQEHAFLKDYNVKMCKRNTKSHQSSSCEFKLVAIETNWLTKLLRHVVSCHRRALSVINSDYSIQRIFPHWVQDGHAFWQLLLWWCECWYMGHTYIHTCLLVQVWINSSPSLSNHCLWYGKLWGPSQRVVTLVNSINYSFN